MTFLFDIDGTICTTTGTAYQKSKPIPEMVDIIRDLYGAGHTIYFITGRGFMDGPRRWQAVAKMTRKQLDAWGVPFHGLYSKPAADVFVDDRGVNAADFRLLVGLLGTESA